MGRSVERLPDCCGPSSGPKKVACLLGKSQREASKLVAKIAAVGGHRLLVNNRHSPWKKIFQGDKWSRYLQLSIGNRRCHQHLTHEGAAGIAIQLNRAGCDSFLAGRINTDNIRGLPYATTSSSSPIAKHQQASCDWDISYSFATS